MSEDKDFKKNKKEDIIVDKFVDKVDKKDIKFDTRTTTEKTINKDSKKPFDIRKKIEDIENSKMPDYQKDEYVKRLLPISSEKEGIPFNVYVKIKGISDINASAMKSYPKAVSVDIATMESWDEIFTDF